MKELSKKYNKIDTVAFSSYRLIFQYARGETTLSEK